MEIRLMSGEHSRSPGVRLKGGQACIVSESGRESGRNEPAPQLNMQPHSHRLRQETATGVESLGPKRARMTASIDKSSGERLNDAVHQESTGDMCGSASRSRSAVTVF